MLEKWFPAVNIYDAERSDGPKQVVTPENIKKVFPRDS